MTKKLRKLIIKYQNKTGVNKYAARQMVEKLLAEEKGNE